ncbi:MAG: hypothetical protein ACHQRL_01015 [Gemmatimonadales bacterium]|jgi:hypothetical protein
MNLDTSWSHSRRSLRFLSMLAAAAAMSTGCTRQSGNGEDSDLYVQGRIHVEKTTKTRWDSAEKDVAQAGKNLHPIRVRDSSSTIPVADLTPASLRALKASDRHGAGDKRLLSIIDGSDAKKVVRSSGIVAEVTLVRGSEYKSEDDFKDGWLPLAIVVLPPRAPGDPVVYPKLTLHGDTSWVFVRERKDSSWAGSLVRIVDGKVEQDPLNVTASSDSLEPVLGARFAWEENDESIWGTCGGKCCKMTGK